MQVASRTSLLVVSIAVWGCESVEPAEDSEVPEIAVEEGNEGNEGHGESTGNDPDGPEELARWSFLIFMNGDNDLEQYVTRDLNDLERIGSGDGVHVIVQADRNPGYVTDDGDWTGTRRYYITKDDNEDEVSSPVIEDLGEADMGSPATLSDFLLWAHQEYPAAQTALVVWSHGDGWSTLSSDATSRNSLSIAGGQLNEGLEEFVRLNGPLDVIAFYASLMGSWEVAHSLQGYAHYMDASEAEISAVGVPGSEAVALLREDPEVDGAALADTLASTSVADGEVTYSSVSIDALGELSGAVDDLARAVVDDDTLVQPLLDARGQARGVYDGLDDWFLDLNDLGAQLSSSDNATLQSHGDAIQTGIDTTVIGAYGNDRYGWTGGLTIMFDTASARNLDLYTNGAGATWSQQTAWGDLLRQLSTLREPSTR